MQAAALKPWPEEKHKEGEEGGQTPPCKQHEQLPGPQQPMGMSNCSGCGAGESLPPPAGDEVDCFPAKASIFKPLSLNRDQNLE